MRWTKWMVGAILIVGAGLALVWFNQRAEQQRVEESQNNVVHLAVALRGYAQFNQGRLPTASIYGQNGKALLSWRVAILPYLEQAHLHQKFKLDEPWDSPHNHALLAEMPTVFAPVGKTSAEPYSTYYQVVTGPGTAFDGPMGVRLEPASFPKGMGATYLLVEAAEAVPWTKSADLPAAPEASALGGLFGGNFNAAFVDGTVRFIRKGKSQSGQQ